MVGWLVFVVVYCLMLFVVCDWMCVASGCLSLVDGIIVYVCLLLFVVYCRVLLVRAYGCLLFVVVRCVLCS